MDGDDLDEVIETLREQALGIEAQYERQASAAAVRSVRPIISAVVTFKDCTLRQHGRRPNHPSLV